MWKKFILSIILFFQLLIGVISLSEPQENLLKNICADLETNKQFKNCSYKQVLRCYFNITCSHPSGIKEIHFEVDNFKKLSIDCLQPGIRIQLSAFFNATDTFIDRNDKINNLISSTMMITNCELKLPSNNQIWSKGIGADIKSMNLRNIPASNLKYFKGSHTIHLELVDIDLNGKLGDLKSFANLSVLHLDNNNLTTLDGFNIAILDQLSTKNNKIQSISRKTFATFFRISELLLFGTEIETIPFDTFNGMVLRNLYFESNKILKFPSNNFPMRSTVFGFVNSKKNIASLPDYFFNDEQSTHKVTLSCGLTSVSNELFQPLESLLELSLSGNNLTSLPKDFLSHSDQILFLNISHNFIKSLPDNFMSIQAFTLDVSYNLLTNWNR